MLEKTLCKRSKLSLNFNNKKIENLDFNQRTEIANKIKELKAEIKSNQKTNFTLDELNSLEKLPILTYDRHLLDEFDELVKESLTICFQADIINATRQKLNNQLHFFDIDIAKKCPFVIAFLNLNYLNSLGDFYLSHLNQNMERTNKRLNKKICELTNIEDLEISSKEENNYIINNNEKRRNSKGENNNNNNGKEKNIFINKIFYKNKSSTF